MFVDECHVTRVNQGLFSTTMEAEKRDPGNEVEIWPWLEFSRRLRSLSWDLLAAIRGLLSSVLFFLLSFLNDIWWFRHLVLNSVAVRPTCVSVLSAVVMVA